MKLTLTKEEATDIIQKYYHLEGLAFELEITAETKGAEPIEVQVFEPVALIEEKLEEKKKSKPEKKFVTTLDHNNFVLDVQEEEVVKKRHVGSRQKIDYTQYAEIVEEFLNSDAIVKVVPNEGIAPDTLRMRYKKAAKLFGLDVKIQQAAGNISLRKA